MDDLPSPCLLQPKQRKPAVAVSDGSEESEKSDEQAGKFPNKLRTMFSPSVQGRRRIWEGGCYEACMAFGPPT